MKVINERSQIRDVASRWDDTYKNGAPLGKGDVSRRLHELDPESATAADVENIIGNPYWTARRDCDECGEPSDTVVQLGQEPDYEGATAKICGSCLVYAIQLLSSKR